MLCTRVLLFAGNQIVTYKLKCLKRFSLVHEMRIFDMTIKPMIKPDLKSKKRAKKFTEIEEIPDDINWAKESRAISGPDFSRCKIPIPIFDYLLIAL